MISRGGASSSCISLMIDYEQIKILHERGDIDAAIAGYVAMLDTQYEDADILLRLGSCYMQKRQFGLALTLFMAAGGINPDEPAVYQNTGTCFRMMSQYDDAEGAYRKGIEIATQRLRDKEGTKAEVSIRSLLGQMYGNLAGLHVNNGTPKTALEIYKKGLIVDPDNPVLKFNQCFGYLEQFQWKEGWPLYHVGFECGVRNTRSYKGVSEWDGSPGKRLIVWGEQGIGDEIMFASCIPDVMKISEKVIFDCHPRLTKTFHRSFGIDCYGTRKNALNVDWLHNSGANASVCLSDLASYFRKDDKDFPGTPYLKAPQIMLPGKKPSIGISWKGGTVDTRANVRSMTLQILKPILELDADFYSLQYTEGASKEVCDLEASTGIHLRHFPPYVETKNYDITMSYIASMDLVISVCTSAVHAAGALGVPCWVLTPSKPAWRYGTEGRRMPWYNSVELFRQKKEEPWSVVIEEVKGRVAEFLARDTVRKIA